MKRGDIYSAKNIHQNTEISVIILKKHIGQDMVAVCPIVPEKRKYTCDVYIDGKYIHVDVGQLYTCKESDLLAKKRELSASEMDKINKACISAIVE